MSFATAGEQFTDDEFLDYTQGLLTIDTVNWLVLMDLLDDDPTGDNLVEYEAHVLGAVALQQIGRFVRDNNPFTDGTALTSQGVTADETSTAVNGAKYKTHAMVAARSRDVPYPHIVLSRVPESLNLTEMLEMEGDAFTLPLVEDVREESLTLQGIHDALAVAFDSNWSHPEWSRAWPPPISDQDHGVPLGPKYR